MGKIIVANWKEYLATEAEAGELARASDFENAVICPPHWILERLEVGKLDGVPFVQHAALGAQDYEEGLVQRGVWYVIIGHSSRRREGDTNAIIADKFEKALRDGLVPLLCVESVEQAQAALQNFHYPASSIQLYLVYEPVWAISTEPGAHAETPEYAAQMICTIKQTLLDWKLDIGNWKFLYGGSVTSANARSFLDQHDIDGLLVGAASLDKEEITTLCGLGKQMESQKP